MPTTNRRYEDGRPEADHHRRRLVNPAFCRVGFCALAVAGWTMGFDTSNSASAASDIGASTLASGTSTVQLASDATYGNILTTEAGFALYTLNTDQGGQSTCTGGCAAAWPALTVPNGTTPTGGTGVTGVLGTAPQSNGTLQVTYNGSLLYTFAGDSPGQVTGQGSDGFSVVTVSAGTTTTTTTTSPSPTTSTSTTSTTSTTTSTTSVPSPSVGTTTTTTSPVFAVVSSPSSTGNTGTGSPALATTGPGEDTPVLLSVGFGLLATGALGRRRFMGFARRAGRSRLQ
jgi:predicted lipoprotein with Yx(FWY)xxD motif